jgi:hypothetical protein
MRLMTLLLAFAFAVGALSPCAFDRAGRVAPGASPHEHAHHAKSADTQPCHGAPAAVIKAPCPCGCTEHARGAVSLGSLGVALLTSAETLPPSARAALGVRERATFVSAASRRIERVPRAA